MTDNVYSTICPGCNFGCGLYIREGEELEVDFRKSSPANAGKLCRFGMKLPELYAPAKSTIDGKEVSMEDAAKEAAKRLSKSAALVSFGNTTCEEVLAFRKLSEKIGAPIYTGIDLEALPEDTHPSIRVGIPYSEVEAAKHIVLFIDPYTQYPLIVRRLVSAKKKGAKITSVGWKELPLADENVSPSDIPKLELTKDSLVIADIHPLSDMEQVKSALSIAQKAGARITFLKPFGNSTGEYLLSKEGGSLSNLVEEIEKGAIKTLYCLESDIVEVMPESTLEKLENLIVQTGRESPTSRKANIVVAPEPLYRKKGELVNNEGRVQALGGDATGGLEALGMVAGDPFEFEALQGEVLKTMGIEAVDEFTVPKYDRPAYGSLEAKPAEAAGTSLVTEYTPFTWSGLSDDNDFVELNLKMVRALKLLKGGKVKISSNGASMETKFKVAHVQDNILITEKRMTLAKAVVTPVEVSR